MDERLYEAARFCLVTGIPYGKTFLELTVRERRAFAEAHNQIQKEEA